LYDEILIDGDDSFNFAEWEGGFKLRQSCGIFEREGCLWWAGAGIGDAFDAIEIEEAFM
jgi:hypothetical protein